MKKILKLISGLLCVVLICGCVFSIDKVNSSNIDTPTRNVELTSQQINSESCYKAFDSYEYDLNDGILEFTGYDSLMLSDLYELDLVSDENLESAQITTKYICNYDYENSIVSLSIAFVDGTETEILDTIYGIICMNDDLEFDVSFDIEGETVYLSELSDVEIVENCGFFKNLFNKVKEKVVNTVNNVVNTTKKVLSTTSGKVGTILTVGACAVAGAVCAVVPGCQVGTAIFIGMAVGYVGASTTAAVSTYQQDGKVDWNAVSTYGQVGAVVGGAVAGISYGVTTAISKAVTSPCTNGVNCFIAGTLISTLNGKLPIENISVGDFVLATNVENNDISYKKVKNLFRNETYEWIHLYANGEEITCTPSHPFYIESKGWIRAKNINSGDCLVTSNHENVIVEEVLIEKLASPEVTYNFEVEDYHTYYVGENSILVHNKCTSNQSLNNAIKNNNVPNTKFDQSQLQHEFKHAKDLGIEGNWNSANCTKFQEAIQYNMNNATNLMKSTYRGQEIYVYYNAATNVGVYTDLAGNFMCSWALSEEQLAFHLAQLILF